MDILAALPSELAWPTTCLMAYAAAEWLFRTWQIPRISTYALIGFLLAHSQLGMLPEKPSRAMVFLANISFGLLLFECGYRFNWHWFKKNPSLLPISILESTATLCSVWYVSTLLGLSQMHALVLATLCVPTSPATVLRVMHESKASGQVTERLLHFSMLNCIYAVIAFKTIVGIRVFHDTGNTFNALTESLWIVIASLCLGALFGWLMPRLLRSLKRAPSDSGTALVLGLVLVVAITDSLMLSSIVVSFAYGVTARNSGIVLSNRERNFGVLGEILSLFLFVFVAASVTLDAVLSGIVIATVLIVVRIGSTVTVTTTLAHVSGINRKKGAMLGFAMAPMSAFVVLLLEQTPYLGPRFVNELPALAAIVLFMEMLGPLMTLVALRVAGETETER